ncbi:MAG: alanine--tRNA ligase [Desulfurococcales archaeon]|nr:alanine--tRNA ligase [Desulfurococcales archaeon]
MSSLDPKEFEVDFFREMGFRRKIGKKCREAFWTLNPDFEEPQDAPCVSYWFDEIPSRERLDVSESRRRFIEFFTKRGHEYVKPRPVVARWREDLFLTIASIVVFQPHVTSGLVPPPANPLVISQPSIRLEDIDNVGLTIGRHLTSFEMAAHHAFNYPDKRVYWKDETVRFAFEFFTKELGIPEDLIVFKESWWEGGGNAGPCFEVAVGGLELATLVFMKYEVIGGDYREIPLKIVDTGYGVERIAWFTSKTPTGFHAIYGGLVSRFRDSLGVEEPDDRVMWAAFKAAGRLDPDDEHSVNEYYKTVSKAAGLSVEKAREVLEREARLYSVLDHTRTLALMLGDGIVPSNSGEGYLARLVARRTMKQLLMLGVESGLVDLVEMQVETWKADFPQLRENRDYILDAVQLEEEKFREALRRGLRLVDSMLRRRGSSIDLVKIYDSHGIPPEIVVEQAAKRGIKLHVPRNFYSMVASLHSGAPLRAEKAEEPQRDGWARRLKPTRPLFHEDPYMRRFSSKVLDCRGNLLVLEATAFYPTGGGQIHDTGRIVSGGRVYRVVDVYSLDNGVIIHVLDRNYEGSPGETIEGLIDWERRYRIMRHHTATHALLGALRRVLGSHVWQAGAEKTEGKGRLDITHHRPITREQIHAIERLVNKVIDERRPVRAMIKPKNEAEEIHGFTIYQGGVPLKPEIRIVEIEGWDTEACYGTHVSNTGEIGSFRIIGVERIQDGVVRLEYVAGGRVAEEARNLEEKLATVSSMIGSDPRSVENRLESLLKEFRETSEALKKYRDFWLKSLEERIASIEPVEGARILVIEPLEKDPRTVRAVMRKLTSTYPDLVIIAIYMGVPTSIEVAVGDSVAASLATASLVSGRLASLLGGKGGGGRTFASLKVQGPVDPKRVEEIVRDVMKR